MRLSWPLALLAPPEGGCSEEPQRHLAGTEAMVCFRLAVSRARMMSLQLGGRALAPSPSDSSVGSREPVRRGSWSPRAWGLCLPFQCKGSQELLVWPAGRE